MKTAKGRPAWAFILSIALVLIWQSMGTISPRAEISDLSPEGIRDFLNNNGGVDSTDKFLQNLPAAFKNDWIMMTDSESAQTGTATRPRFIIPNPGSSRVFGFALDSQIIEYLHFESATNKFRFHEITMNGGGNGGTISIDAPSCLRCHASRRAGVRGTGPRPNWDAYDSWGGMLPFNRDRIYQEAKVNGVVEESVEAQAIKRIFKSLKDNALYKELMLPNGISQELNTACTAAGAPFPCCTGAGTGTCNGDVTIAFAPCNAGIGGPQPCKTDSGTGPVDVKYALDAADNVSYPGPNGPISVTQGGKYLRLQHSVKGPNTDEGRGVALFDNFTENNVKRVAQELADFPPNPVDIRYVALAIAKDCVTANTLGKYAPKEALTKLLAFQTNLDPAVTTFPELLGDTRTRMESLPQRKANLESDNLKGLIEANNNAACTAAGAPFPCCTGAGLGTCQSIDNAACTAAGAPFPCCTGAGMGTCDFTTERITANIARRSDTNPAQTFNLDQNTLFMIDREYYDINTDPPNSSNETFKMALFRLYLEPLGVAVDTWSMSVKTSTTAGRHRTYTFGDLFRLYIPEIKSQLQTALGVAATVKCSDLAANSIKQFVKGF